MSASFGSEGSGEVELNIAPIVDCFVVLIAYTLVSASFITLAALDVDVASSGPAVQQEQPQIPPEIPITMSVTISDLPARHADIKVTGGKENFNETYTVTPKPDGNWDEDSIKSKMTEVLGHHPGRISEANINADQDIEYRFIVPIVQTLKGMLKKVYLAG